MADRRHKDQDWKLMPLEEDRTTSLENIRAAVLMDIRDELRDPNRLLRCPNFTGIPASLKAIQRNTVKPRFKKRGTKRAAT